MEVDSNLLFWSIVIIAFAFIILVAWIHGNYIRISKLDKYNDELIEENKKWKEQYEHGVGKHIKHVLASLTHLEINDKRKTETKRIMGISYEKHDLNWTDRSDEIQMWFDTDDGYHISMSFNKKEIEKND